MTSHVNKTKNSLSQRNLFVTISTCTVLVFAISIAAFSIYILFDLGDIFEIVPSQYYRNGVYIASFAGIILVVICFISICGAMQRNRFFLIVSAVFYFLLIWLLLVAGIFILVFDKNMDVSAQQTMEDSLVNWYNRTTLISRAWDQTQTRFRCCAVSDLGWNLYRSSYWSKAINRNEFFPETMIDSNPFYKMVPETCCYTVIDGITGWPTATMLDVYACQHFQLGPPRFNSGAHNTAIYYRGCFNATKSYINHFSGWLASLSLVSILVLLIAMVAIVMLMNSLGETKTD